MSTPVKVLIIRSAPTYIFEKAFANIRESSKDTLIDVYSPKHLSAQIAKQEGIHAVYDDNWEGLYKKEYITPALIKKLSEQDYDHIVVLYNDEHGSGYEIIQTLALKIKASRVSSFNTKEVWSPLEKKSVFSRKLLSQKRTYQFLIFIFATEIIITTIIDRFAYMARRCLGISRPTPPPHKRG
jgi:hypothetical protein